MEEFSDVNHLNEGLTAKVFRALYKGEKVIVKCVRASSIDMALNELKIFAFLEQQKVSGLYRLKSSFEKEGETYILFEDDWPENVMDLFDFFTTYSVQEDEALFIFNKLARIVFRLRERGVFHGDVKLENVIINPSTMHIRLVDFGCARLLNPWKSFFPPPWHGTVEYWPPECHRHPAKVTYDGMLCYSLGTTLYAMLNTDVQDQRTKVTVKESISCKSFLESLLEADPSKRLPFALFFCPFNGFEVNFQRYKRFGLGKEEMITWLHQHPQHANTSSVISFKAQLHRDQKPWNQTTLRQLLTILARDATYFEKNFSTTLETHLTHQAQGSMKRDGDHWWWYF